MTQPSWQQGASQERSNKIKNILIKKIKKATILNNTKNKSLPFLGTFFGIFIVLCITPVV
jgi:hypothetical protein